MIKVGKLKSIGCIILLNFLIISSFAKAETYFLNDTLTVNGHLSGDLKEQRLKPILVDAFENDIFSPLVKEIFGSNPIMCSYPKLNQDILESELPTCKTDYDEVQAEKAILIAASKLSDQGYDPSSLDNFTSLVELSLNYYFSIEISTEY